MKLLIVRIAAFKYSVKCNFPFPVLKQQLTTDLLMPVHISLTYCRTHSCHGTSRVPYDNQISPCTLTGNLDTCWHQSGFQGECYGIDKSPTGSALRVLSCTANSRSRTSESYITVIWERIDICVHVSDVFAQWVSRSVAKFQLSTTKFQIHDI